MRVTLKSSGGVGGFNSETEGHLETDDCPGLEQRIKKLEQNGELQAFAPPPRHPDGQTVVIELHGNRRASFVVDESSASDNVLGLIDDIRRLLAR